jgi:hypothetical protein
MGVKRDRPGSAGDASNRPAETTSEAILLWFLLLFQGHLGGFSNVDECRAGVREPLGPKRCVLLMEDVDQFLFLGGPLQPQHSVWGRDPKTLTVVGINK